MRVLDYGTPNPFEGVIGRPRTIAWPVHAFRITLPESRSGRGGLDPFEQVISKMIEIDGFKSVETLAEEVCLPQHLVLTVLARLRSKGVIDANNNVPNGHSRNRRDDRRERYFDTAIVYRELVNGTLLPHLHIVSSGSSQRFRVIEDRSLFTMRIAPNVDELSAPSSRDILEVLRTIRRREKFGSSDERLPGIHQIQVFEVPELHHLASLIAISESDAKPRLADPFNRRQSRELTEVFSRQLLEDTVLQEWVARWRESLIGQKINHGSARLRTPVGSDGDDGPFSRLIEFLNVPEGDRYRTPESTYASIEWALYYTSQIQNSKKAMESMLLVGIGDFNDWIKGVINEVGFHENHLFVEWIRQGKYEDYRSGKPELNTVLCLCLMQAQFDQRHPLRTVAREIPTLLTELEELKGLRGGASHGKSVAWEDVYDYWDQFLRKLIRLLLPNIKFEDGNALSSRAPYIDSLLTARNSLTARLGVRCLEEIGHNVEESLINAERFALRGTSSDNAIGFVSYLYSALQGTIEAALEKYRGGQEIDRPASSLIEMAESRATSFGLLGFGTSLRTVTEWRMRRALTGGSTTLGPLIIAFLLFVDDDSLFSIVADDPLFLENCSLILDRRGHGNMQVPLTEEEIRTYRDATIHTIVTITEICRGRP